MPSNTPLKTLLFNARLVYLIKNQAVQAQATRQKALLRALHDKYLTLFGHLANPQLWKTPIPFSPEQTAALVLSLNDVDPTQTTDFLHCADALYLHLSDELLKTSLATLATTSTSTWNLKMRNALRLTLQEIDQRKDFFKTQGTDLDQGTEYPQMEGHQLELVSTYRQLLQTNSVKATESRVNNIKTRRSMIAAATKVKLFLGMHRRLTAYISKQILRVSLISHFAESSSAENKKTLEALAATLIKMDHKIAVLAANGKDFTQEADFDTLHSEQQSLQADYQKALLSNTIDSSSSDVDQIVQIADALPRVEKLASLKKQYKALNEVMRKAVLV